MRFFQKYQKKVFDYFSAHQPRFLFLTFVAIFLLFLGQLPFLNLILSPWVIFFLLWLIATVILGLSQNILFFNIIILFLLCFFLLLLDRREQAEEIGVVIFAFLVIAVGKSLKDLVGK